MTRISKKTLTSSKLKPKQKTKTTRTKSGRKPSSPKKTRGDDLFDQVVKLTGLPGQTIRRELKSILERKNIDINQLTLDQLRFVVASYLREIMDGLLERTGNQRRQETKH